MSLIIERLGHQGDGIAPGPVFVERSLPGEVVAGEVTDDRIAQPRILTPSPDRVRPPCRHFRACGGCSVQHAADPFIAAWKADIVRNAMHAQGLEAPITGVATSPAQTRRRATLAGKRTKSGAMVGFHARGSATLIEIPDCRLLLPEIMALIPALERLTVIGASRKAEIALAVTWSDGGADIVVAGGKPLDGPLRVELASFTQTPGIARLTWGDEPVATQHAPAQQFDGIRVIPPPGAFLQATRHGEQALLDAVRGAVGPAGSVVDLFAGCGTFALPLARQATVHAVESAPEMLGALDTAWRGASGLKHVATETRDLFRRPLLAGELNRHAAAVIDPPRAGAEAQCRELAKSDVPRIAFVSCNPVTFARDARILIEAGYVLDRIDVVDQFRWSAHVELAAAFRRDHIGPAQTK